MRNRSSLTRRIFVLIQRLGRIRLLLRMDFGTLLFFQDVFPNGYFYTVRRITDRVVAQVGSMITVSVFIGRYEGLDRGFHFERTSRHFRFFISTESDLRICASLMARSAYLRVNRIIYLTLFRYLQISLLLRLLNFRRVAQIMFMQRNGQCSIRFLRAISGITFPSRNRRLRRTILYTIIKIFHATFALYGPRVLLLLYCNGIGMA